MSVEFSLEDVIKQLLNAVERNIAWARNLNPAEGSGRTAKHFFYCPECLRVDVYFKNQVYYYTKRKGKRIECFKCRVEMKPIDDQFKAEYERVMRTYYEKAKSLLERTWKLLESWWRGISKVELLPDSVKVYFDYPSYIEIYRDKKDVKVRLYLHYVYYEYDLEKFLELLNAVKTSGLHGEVRVDGRLDHCTVPKEEMRRLGFIRLSDVGRIPDDWYTEF
jgi:hypothetical protein